MYGKWKQTKNRESGVGNGMKSIVFAGSRGIGKEICNQLREITDELVFTSKQEVDTSDLESVKQFIEKHPYADVLVLNTGGPESIPFEDITEDIWYKYFNQLFLSFVLILQNIKVNEGGYVFLISSFNIKEPDPKLILSNSLRIGFTSVFKSLSKLYMDKRVSFINIAPGPTETDRLLNLLGNSGTTIEQFAESLPTKRVAAPSDIGKFVKFLVENKISSLNGVTLNFDMGLSNYVL